jgi:xylulokinase
VEGTYLALAATLGAGLTLRWLREEVFDDRSEGSAARLTTLAEMTPPGAGGLLFLPYLAGERAPLLDPAASGVLLGLRLEHGRPHLARAALEGVAMSLRHALEPLQAAGVRADRVILAGGLARSALMRAIIAGVLDRPITPLETAEQSALGAALLAGVHAGFSPSLEAACGAMVQCGPPVAPDPDHVDRYAELYGRYRGLYPALRETMHALGPTLWER